MISIHEKVMPRSGSHAIFDLPIPSFITCRRCPAPITLSKQNVGIRVGLLHCIEGPCACLICTFQGALKESFKLLFSDVGLCRVHLLLAQAWYKSLRDSFLRNCEMTASRQALRASPSSRMWGGTGLISLPSLWDSRMGCSASPICICQRCKNSCQIR